MSLEKSELLRLTRYFSAAPWHVQGGGGNTSVKVDGKMWVKASGFRLKDVSESSGLVDVELQAFTDGLKRLFLTGNIDKEAEYSALVKGQASEVLGLRPSLETGFHALLPKFVIHTHSLAFLGLLCAQNGPDALSQILSDCGGDVFHVGYDTPGYSVTEKIWNGVVPGIDPVRVSIVCLENHGVIFTSNSSESIIEVYEGILSILKREYEFPEIATFEIRKMSDHYSLFWDELSSPSSQQRFSKDWFLEEVLCPDQAIVLSHVAHGDGFLDDESSPLGHKNEKLLESVAEMIASCVFVRDFCKINELEPQFLQPKEVHNLLGLDSEKYRKKLMSK